MTQNDYLLCGLRVRSGLPLSELPAWPGDASGCPDVVVVETQVADRLDDGVTDPESWTTVGADGAVLLQAPDVVRIRVCGGKRIEVEILRRDEEQEWRLFLLGSALGYLCHQRGFLPLHAASLRIGDRTVAIAGPSGAGKSTLSLALTRRGHALLSDDVTVLRVEGQAPAQVLPAYPRLKLWRDALTAQGVATAGLRRVIKDMDKYDLRPGAGFDPTPRPLDAVLMLQEGEASELRRLPTLEAAPAVLENVYRSNVGLLLGRRASLFAQAVAVAGATPVYEFRRPRDFDSLEACAASIEAVFAQ